jgi:DNA-binding Lrp family transcriptional regulator
MAVMLTTGRYDMMIAAIFHERREVFNFLDVTLSGSADLLDTELMMVVKIFKSSWMYIHGDTGASGDQPRRLDEPDLDLIKMLETSPRDSISSLSKKLGMRRQSLSKRLQSLVDSNVINVASILNPRAIGLGMQVMILVKVHPSKIGAVANAFITHNRVNHLVVITGPFQIAMWIIVKDLDELACFLKDDLGGVSGIVNHEAIVITNFPKLSLKYLTY